jgi:uncharacterized repeat protein (TIGR03803 family)
VSKMKLSECRLSRAVSVSAAVVMLAGCGGSQPPIGAPGATLQAATSSTYTVLHHFNSRSTGPGWDPWASLLDANGTLYGTTFDGGSSGDGSVYSMNARGAATVLHAFSGKPSDGADPEAGLIDANGTLYGTTFVGGVKRRWNRLQYRHERRGDSALQFQGHWKLGWILPTGSFGRRERHAVRHYASRRRLEL